MNPYLTTVGKKVTDATANNHRLVISTAQTIAAICEAKAANAIPLLAGDKDVLPALHAALGSGLAAGRDLHKAQLGTRQIAKRLGIRLDGDDVPACPCGEGITSSESPRLALVHPSETSLAA